MLGLVVSYWHLSETEIVYRRPNKANGGDFDVHLFPMLLQKTKCLGFLCVLTGLLLDFGGLKNGSCILFEGK